jgi:predicted NUDIX family NTP pyrophosphohydrolase
MLRSNSFELEYPVGSGTLKRYPEVDEAVWTGVEVAEDLIHKGQVVIVHALVARFAKKYKTSVPADCTPTIV